MLNKRNSLFIYFLMYFLQHYSGLDEAVYRNIDACKELAATTASAYGPLGKCLKQVVYELLGI